MKIKKSQGALGMIRKQRKQIDRQKTTLIPNTDKPSRNTATLPGKWVPHTEKGIDHMGKMATDQGKWALYTDN
jgi:hypothetical protein